MVTAQERGARRQVAFKRKDLMVLLSCLKFEYA